MFKRRIIGVFCAIIVCVGLLGGVMATMAAEEPAQTTAAEGYALPTDVVISAPTALVVNLGSDISKDTVILSREADEVRAPGSMMRFMVVAYTLHRAQQLGMDINTATGTYTKEMFNQYVAGTGVPTANMQYGETWTVRDLLAVSYMHSASDAVVTLAYAVDGGVEPFIVGMNALAKEIGCTYTHYANLTGLDSLSQYTTARDMYRIIRYAMGFYAQFMEIVAPWDKNPDHQRNRWDVQPVSGGTNRSIFGLNYMLQSSSPYYYSQLIFGRTGLSSYEGRTCASVAREGGYEYLVVVMGCPEKNAAGEGNLHYQDTRTLFRWAFSRFEHKTVLTKNEILASVDVKMSWNADHVNLVPEQEYATIVEKDLNPDTIKKITTKYQTEVDAPVAKGTVLGKVELYINDTHKIGEVNLVAAEDLNRHWLLYSLRGVGNFFSSPWFWGGAILLVALLIGYIVLNISYNRRRRRERLQRLKR